VRVVTLLPAGTEIVAALGGAGELVGISHECDYPSSVQHLSRVTTSRIDPTWSGALIDAEVRRLSQEGRPVTVVDATQLRELRPDIIITQDLCEVCAVADGEVYRLGETMIPAPRVVSLQARDLEGIWYDIRQVALAIDRTSQAEELILELQGRLQRLQMPSWRRPRVLCLEWLEPLYLAGHWVPDLVQAAGGIDVGARAGSHSTTRRWEELSALGPDLLIVMLCGFGVERARAELDGVIDPEALAVLGHTRTWILDGNQYTSRPGPRVVDGAERINALLRGIPAPEVESWQPAVRC
jgi:iron complex transport system substrate-binding protein